MSLFKKKIFNVGLIIILVLVIPVSFAGCGKTEEKPAEVEEAAVQETGAEEVQVENTEESERSEVDADASEESKIDLEDGVYLADFNTDSSMFHVNETKDGKGILTVTDGKAVIHIVLTSKNIKNLYLGLVVDAEKEDAVLLEPTEEEVTYSDGLTETVNAFDVEVPYLEDEFDLALIGKKEVWYDHKVSVSNPVPYTEDAADSEAKEVAELDEEHINVVLEGGTGKSTVESPAQVRVGENGEIIVTIVWSSSKYDYMIVNGEKLLPINDEGNSTFEIVIPDYNCEMDVIADTTAMSTPHEIEYKLTFSK